MKLYDFLTEVLKPIEGQRAGQAFINSAFRLRRDIYEALVMAGHRGAFYDDSMLWSAVEFVKANWEDKIE